MTLSARILVTLLSAGTVSLTAVAAPLNVRPGLWETVTVTEKGRAQPPSNLDQLTPEQREKVEAELATRVKRETRTERSCLTKAKIDSGEAFIGTSHRMPCSREITTSTATEITGRLECKGPNNLEGLITMRAPDPKHMTGVVEMTYSTADGQPMVKTHSEITSKWVQDDCMPVGAQPMPPLTPDSHAD